jgi:hypothetical protein
MDHIVEQSVFPIASAKVDQISTPTTPLSKKDCNKASESIFKQPSNN